MITVKKKESVHYNNSFLFQLSKLIAIHRNHFGAGDILEMYYL